MILDLSLTNEALYRGLEIETLAGKPTLLTPPEAAINRMLANLGELTIDPDEVTLTGAMAVWAYLAVFHYLHGKTRRIYYRDGRGETLLVAAHG